MKQFFTIEQDASENWYFRYEASEDPTNELGGVGLILSPGSSVSDEWSSPASFWGCAYLRHDSVHPREDILKCQKKLREIGWTLAKASED